MSEKKYVDVTFKYNEIEEILYSLRQQGMKLGSPIYNKLIKARAELEQLEHV